MFCKVVPIDKLQRDLKNSLIHFESAIFCLGISPAKRCINLIKKLKGNLNYNVNVNGVFLSLLEIAIVSSKIESETDRHDIVKALLENGAEPTNAILQYAINKNKEILITLLNLYKPKTIA